MSKSRQPAPGSQPPGSADEATAARTVRRLFSEVSPRYDLLNHLLSLNTDRYWRRIAARQFRHLLTRPGARVLDLCCGTADLTLALARQGSARIISCDFSHAMLLRARRKLYSCRQPPLVAEADALQLPFPDGCFDLVACSFGFRNLVNYRRGLQEIRRVLRPEGEAAILEFSEPQGRWVGPFYSFYFRHVLPAVGEWISGVPGAYSYLPRSVDQFPDRKQFLEWMQAAGFAAPTARPLTGGIAVLYAGRKPSPETSK